MSTDAIPAVKFVDDLTECAICTTTLTDPRSLRCVHTFCLSCISSCGGGDQQQVACPLCDSKTPIPAFGLTDLPKNGFVEKLIAARRMALAPPPGLVETSTGKDASKPLLCEVCGDDHPGEKGNGDVVASAAAEIAMFCVECRQGMCQRCAGHHKKIRQSSSHQLVEVDAKRTNLQQLVVKFADVFCDVHAGRRLEIYCVDCRQPVCTHCFIDYHQSHERRDVSDAAAEFDKRMRADVAGVTGLAENCRKKLVEVMVASCGHDSLVSDVERQINERADNLTAFVNKAKVDQLQRLAAVAEERRRALETSKDDLERGLVMMESFRRYSDELVNNGTVYDIVRAAEDLHDRASQLEQIVVYQGDLNSVLEVPTMTLDFPDLPAVATDIEIAFGSLTTYEPITANCSDTFPAEPVQATVVVPSNEFRVGGVAVLGDEVYVVRCLCDCVQVYDALSMSEKRVIRVPGLQQVHCGLAACSVNRCLYVADTVRSAICRIDLRSSSALTAGHQPPAAMQSWSVARGPDGLSVNAARNVLVAVYGSNQIQEFTTNGQHVRTLRIDGIANPKQAVELPLTGHVAVTHRSDLSIVTADGGLVANYAGCRNPYGLAVSRRGFIFVADTNNNRIVVFNARSSTSRKLEIDVDGDGLRSPICLCLDERRDRLYVGEAAGKRVVVVNAIDRMRFP